MNVDLGWSRDSRNRRHNRDRNSQRADSSDTLRELSGRFCRRQYLLRRRGLLRTNDARADVRKKPWVNRAAS